MRRAISVRRGANERGSEGIRADQTRAAKSCSSHDQPARRERDQAAHVFIARHCAVSQAMTDYPTDEQLERIATWPFADAPGWFAFIKASGHWWPDESWGWDEMDGPAKECWYLDKPGRIYRISTGGWSGNESIIEAMQKNFELWHLTWVTHRVGGHYEFLVRPERPTPTP